MNEKERNGKKRKQQKRTEKNRKERKGKGKKDKFNGPPIYPIRLLIGPNLNDNFDMCPFYGNILR